MVKKVTIVMIGLIALSNMIIGQDQNPFIQNTTISPVPLLPLEFNGVGELSFEVGNDGVDDLPLVANQEMTIVLSLSNGVPNDVDPLNALGGSAVTWFDWSYEPSTKTYWAIQNQLIAGSSVGDVTIQYEVDKNTPMTSPSNGFNVNLQPPPYSNGSNTTVDDADSEYTYTIGIDFGDAPLSYGEAEHELNLIQIGGSYTDYIYLGQSVDLDIEYNESLDGEGDDLDGTDDEDGVTFPTMIRGTEVTIPIELTSEDGSLGILRGWIDWNANGVFTDPGEQVIAFVPVSMSTIHMLTLTIPNDAVLGSTFARFRVGSFSVSNSFAPDNFGEVEDYMINIVSEDPCKLPVLTVGSPICDANLGTYTVIYYSSTGSVLALPTSGTAVVTGTTITADLGADIEITASSGIDCETVLTVTGIVNCPSDCNLSDLTVGQAICDGVGSSTYTVNFTESTGATIEVTGGTNNGDGTVGGMIGTALTITATNGVDCVTPITVSSPASCTEVCETPDISIGGTRCAEDGSATYEVLFTAGTGVIVTSDVGIVNASSISEIPSGIDVTITVEFAGCEISIVTVPSITCFGFGSIGEYVWHDINGDGIQDSSEQGLEGVTLNLYNENSDLVATTVADENGFYMFTNINPDTYFIEFLDPDGFISTFSNQGNNEAADSDITNEIIVPNGGSTTSLFLIGPGEDNLDVDGGYYMCVPIGETVWDDTNTDNIEDPTENGINGMEVILWKLVDGAWEEWDNMFTDLKPGTSSDDGYYKFCAPPGTYYLNFESPPIGLVQVQPNVGSDLTDSDITNGNGLGTTDSFTVLSGDEICTIGAGYYPMAEVGNFVWEDSNQNGIQEEGESPLEGVMVQAYDLNDNVVSEVITDDNGEYNMDYLQQESFYFKFTPPTGFAATVANAGDDDIDSDVTHAYGSNTTNAYSLNSGDQLINVDAGMSLAVLPVEWLFLRAANRGDHNLIEWSTAKEINSDYYEVERRVGNDPSFRSLGKVSAAGISTERTNYSYLDYELLPMGNYYYRIKQIDTDGAIDFSDIVVVTIDRKEVQLSLYPNPAINATLIMVTGSEVKDAKVTVFTKEGKLIRSGLILDEISSGNYELILDASAFLPGVYTVQIETMQDTWTEKLIVIR